MGEHGKHRKLVRALAPGLAVIAPVAARAQDCAVALVLALDVSSSVDSREYALQMQGLAAAFRDVAVIETILTPPGAGIMATAFAWSGFQRQKVLIDWRWLGDKAAIEAFASALSAARRPDDAWPTALGRSSGFAADMARTAPRPCARRVVDISGDGANNDGVSPGWYRERGYFDGITINGLVIAGATPDPVEYYREQVVHGPGAFVEVADSYDDYAPAILRKLLRELAPPYAMLETRK